MPSFRGSPIPGIVHMILHLLHWQVGSLSLATWEAQLLNNHQQKVWNLPKKIFYFQRQRSHNKTAEEEHSWYNQIPYLPGRQPKNWKIITLQRFSHRSESTWPHLRLPSLGVWHWPPEHLALKANRAWLQELHKSEGNRNSIPADHIQGLMHTGTQGEKQ